MHASAAGAYVLAMLASNMALRWVPYPTQVIGKSAKPIPVMVLGVLIGRKSYPLRKYVFIVLIVVGVVLFMLKGDKLKHDFNTDGYGEMLLLGSLTMDGLLGAIQERMRAGSAPSAQQMMLAMNGWSTAFLICGVLVSGELLGFLQFADKYPEVWLKMIMLAAAGAIGQLFIFTMV